MGRRRVTRGAAAASLALLVVAGSIGGASAQGGAPLAPGPVVAVPAASVAPPLDVAVVAVAAEAPAGTVEVVVGFREPVVLPPLDYRLSAVVGVPGGARTRASLVVGPDGPRGEAEVTEGELAPGAAPAWRSLGPAPAALAAGGASAVIQVPSPGAPGEAVWVEAELGPPFAAARRTTPYVALDALHPEGAAPGLAPNPWLAGPPPAGAEEGVPPAGASAPGAPALAVGEGPDGAPVLVATIEAAPTDVAGAAVVEAVDLVRLTGPGGPGGAVAVDRTRGTVQLVGADGEALVAPPGQVVVGEADPRGPGALHLDLGVVATALGLPPGPGGQGVDPATRVRADRLVTTAAGDRWSGTGATATVAWLTPTGGAGQGGTVSTGGAADDGTSPGRLALAVGAVALALGVVVAGVVAARGRDRRRGPRPRAPGAGRRDAARAPEPRGGRSPEEALAALEAELAALDDRGG